MHDLKVAIDDGKQSWKLSVESHSQHAGALRIRARNALGGSFFMESSPSRHGKEAACYSYDSYEISHEDFKKQVSDTVYNYMAAALESARLTHERAGEAPGFAETEKARRNHGHESGVERG